MIRTCATVPAQRTRRMSAFAADRGYVADIFTDQIHVFLTALNQNLIALLFIY